MDQKQAAFKRKFEEAMEQNRRLEEAVETHRKNFIDNELVLLYSALDFKNLLKSLVNDQKVLYKHLCELRAIENKTEANNDQIKQIEDDMEQRRVQIIEMSAKQENMDEKVKRISESFTSISDLRTAVFNLINKLLDSRNDFTTKLTNAENRNNQLLQENLALKIRINKIEKKNEAPFKRRITLFKSDDDELDNDKAISVKTKYETSDPDYWPTSSIKKKSKTVCGCASNGCKWKYCACKKSGVFCGSNCKCSGCLNVETKEGIKKLESIVVHTC